MQKKIETKGHHCTCEVCRLHPYSQETKRHRAINRVLVKLNERNKRRFVGVLANEAGRGGVSRLAEITGMSRVTIARGRGEIERSNKNLPSKIRRPGAGRPLTEKNSQRY